MIIIQLIPFDIIIGSDYQAQSPVPTVDVVGRPLVLRWFWLVGWLIASMGINLINGQEFIFRLSVSLNSHLGRCNDLKKSKYNDNMTFLYENN